MRRAFLLLPAVAFCLAFAAPGALAADAAPGVLDSGRLVVFSHGQPVATEDFEYEQRHDSLFVTCSAERKARGANGSILPYMKSMELIERAASGELLAYVSTEKFDGRKTNRSVMPGDTSITVTTENERGGVADKIVRPPGRTYVLDSGLFTLLDVIGRNLHGRIFGARPVGLIVLGDQTASLEATATPAGSDTLRWGDRPVITERIELADSTLSFTLDLSPTGQLLRAENAKADLVVLRDPPATPAASKRRRPPLPH